jgi:hypothetical protein
MWALQREYIASMADVRLLFRREVRFAHLAIDRPEADMHMELDFPFFWTDEKSAAVPNP